MESGVNHPRLDPLSHSGAQHRIARAAGDADPIPFADAAFLRVVRMDFEAILRMPAVVLGTPGLRADIKIKGQRAFTFSAVGTYSLTRNLPLPRTNSPTCMVGVPSACAALQGHWMLPSSSMRAKLTPVKVGVSRAISSMICAGWA